MVSSDNMASIVELYGPGMSFYLPKSEPEQTAPEQTALEALSTSNSDLEVKMGKLRTNIAHLKTSLKHLQRRVDTTHHACLPRWQADMLTVLIETVCARDHRLSYGNEDGGWGFEYGNGYGNEDGHTMAARRIDRETLGRTTGLSARYHFALQRYHEVVEYRSQDPRKTEKEVAEWLVSVQERNPVLYGFWAELFPVCYNRTVESWS